MADAGTFEYWQAGEQPDAPPEGVDVGTFEYWQAGEQPPVCSGEGADGEVPGMMVRAPIPGWCH